MVDVILRKKGTDEKVDDLKKVMIANNFLNAMSAKITKKTLKLRGIYFIDDIIEMSSTTM